MIISPLYNPEINRVNDLVEHLLRQNHNITVISPIPNYPEGKYYKGGRCSFEDMEESVIENIEENVTDCERRRIFRYLEQWLNKKDLGRNLTLNE